MGLKINKPVPKTPTEMLYQLSVLVEQIVEKKEVLSEDEVIGLLVKTYMTMGVLWAFSSETFKYAFDNAETFVDEAVKKKGGAE